MLGLLYSTDGSGGLVYSAWPVSCARVSAISLVPREGSIVIVGGAAFLSVALPPPDGPTTILNPLFWRSTMLSFSVSDSVASLLTASGSGVLARALALSAACWANSFNLASLSGPSCASGVASIACL